ncbi:hypothetical protein JTB14_017834 [Gonioctena quinquepunctata]|nr:hypothetical protein JTB14_017834 [Gonioctena quinquepunctata]
MTSKNKYYSDEELLQIMENDDLSDIEILSDDDDEWKPEDMFIHTDDEKAKFERDEDMYDVQINEPEQKNGEREPEREEPRMQEQYILITYQHRYWHFLGFH